MLSRNRTNHIKNAGPLPSGKDVTSPQLVHPEKGKIRSRKLIGLQPFLTGPHQLHHLPLPPRPLARHRSSQPAGDRLTSNGSAEPRDRWRRPRHGVAIGTSRKKLKKKKAGFGDPRGFVRLCYALLVKETPQGRPLRWQATTGSTHPGSTREGREI